MLVIVREILHSTALFDKLNCEGNGVSEWDESRGRRLENAVFLALRAARDEGDYEITYYRDQSHEVDFVTVRLGKATRLVQVSYSLDNPSTRKRELSALFAVGEKLCCDNLVLVTDHEDGIETDGRQTVKSSTSWIGCSKRETMSPVETNREILKSNLKISLLSAIRCVMKMED